MVLANNSYQDLRHSGRIDVWIHQTRDLGDVCLAVTGHWNWRQNGIKKWSDADERLAGLVRQ